MWLTESYYIIIDNFINITKSNQTRKSTTYTCVSIEFPLCI